MQSNYQQTFYVKVFFVHILKKRLDINIGGTGPRTEPGATLDFTL